MRQRKQKKYYKPLVQIIFCVVKPNSNLQSIAVTNKTKYVIHDSVDCISTRLLQ